MTSEVCASCCPRPAHWIGARANGGQWRACRRRLRPLDRQAHQTVAFRVLGRCRRSSRGGIGCLFGLAPLVALPAARNCSFAFRQLTNERADELAEIVTSEHGKVLDDALGE